MALAAVHSKAAILLLSVLLVCVGPLFCVNHLVKEEKAGCFTLLLCGYIEPRHEISNNVVCATSKASDQPAHTLTIL